LFFTFSAFSKKLLADFSILKRVVQKRANLSAAGIKILALGRHRTGVELCKMIIFIVSKAAYCQS